MEKIDQVFTATVNVCTALAKNSFAKCLGGFGLFLLHISFDKVGVTAVFAVILLTIFDTMTGLAGAKIADEQITSKKFFNSLVKLIFFPMMVAAGSITEHALGFSFMGLPQIIIGYLAVHEFMSIIENFGKMGFHIPQKILNRENLNSLIGKK